jgi:hypothetical protein
MVEPIYVVAGTLLVVAALYLLRNVFKRLFLATKFMLLPHKYEVVKKEIPLKFAPLAVLTPFFAQVSFKAIAYIVLLAIVGTVCLGLYHKLTADTYSNDYKNNVHGNKVVTLDQRQQIDGISCWGISLGNSCLGLGHAKSVPTNTINNTKGQKPTQQITTTPEEVSNTTVGVETPVVKNTLTQKIKNFILHPIASLGKY